MKLKQLLTAIKYRAEQVPDVDITDLVYDSVKSFRVVLPVLL